jgi:hypothetical protein
MDMRTTVTFAEDVSAAIDQFRRERALGLSDAVNELIRRGLVAPASRKPFVQKTYPMGAKIDLANIGEAMEIAEGPDWR